ncbi:MAG: phytanoyl-CoA dioxygenase family protein [Hyphomicrobiales bacterium]|nr:phytanoyl-CoA dioxygenase family protein [Hyphomicrobiales bacterium]
MSNHGEDGRILSATEREAYATDGLVKPTLRLSPETVAAMRTLLEDTLEATPGQRPETLVCPHIEGMNGLPLNLTSRWLDVCRRPDFVDAIADLIGDDVILWGSQLFCKPAGTGLEVPWHQDGHFWPIRPLATCSLWLAIDDVDEENSAMLYVPGSHAPGTLFPHADQPSEDSALNAEMLPGDVDLDRVAVDALPAGAFSLHDVYLVHGSKPNRSHRRRAGFVIRYMPASSHYDRRAARSGSTHVATKLAERPLFLLHGQDRTDKTGVVDLRPAS